MSHQIGKPRGILDVGLAAGHVLDVGGIAKNQLELAGDELFDAGAFQHVSDLSGTERPVDGGLILIGANPTRSIPRFSSLHSRALAATCIPARRVRVRLTYSITCSKRERSL